MPVATRHPAAGWVIPITLPVTCPAIWVDSRGNTSPFLKRWPLASGPISSGTILSGQIVINPRSRQKPYTACSMPQPAWHVRHVTNRNLFLATAFQIAAADPSFGAPPDQPRHAGKKHHQQHEYKRGRPTKQGRDHRMPEKRRTAKRHDQSAGIDVTADNRLADQKRDHMPL